MSRPKIHGGQLFTVKLPEWVAQDLDYLATQYGIKERRAALEACVATLAQLTRQNCIRSLIGRCQGHPEAWRPYRENDPANAYDTDEFAGANE